MQFHADAIRAYLIDRYETDAVKTGEEADEIKAGLYHGEADSWLVFGVMPNTSETGWFFAGTTEEISRQMPMGRFTVHPCDETGLTSLADLVIGSSDDAVEAKKIADQNSNYIFGVAIRDNVTGQLDIGFGFGVYPEDDEIDQD